jgi:hypothetical protein
MLFGSKSKIYSIRVTICKVTGSIGITAKGYPSTINKGWLLPVMEVFLMIMFVAEPEIPLA